MPTTAPALENKRQARYEDMIGNTFPYVRIRDYVLHKQEILRFELETSKMLPTLILHLALESKTLNRDNAPVDGDRINIWIRQDLKVMRPINGDYIIRNVRTTGEGSSKNKFNEFLIKAELWVPNLKSDKIRFDYFGKAETALKDIAKRLGLGYVHTKLTETKYQQSWYCYNNPFEYIRYVTSHMWLAKDSFFDSWIDVYRNLNVFNMNDMLGRKMSDDGKADITKFQNIIGTVGEDGKYVSNDVDELKGNEWPKIFTNDIRFEHSLMFVQEYDYENHSTKVSQLVGAQVSGELYLQNNGLGQADQDSNENLDIGVWYNQEKLDAGYVIANGPTNYSEVYRTANNGSWRDQQTHIVTNEITPVESDGDQGDKIASQNNNNASGNVFKMFKAAERHNYVNNMELEKQLVILKCNGLNLGIAKGEKVPLLLEEKANDKWVSHVRASNDYSFMLDRKCSGWFIIKGIKWIYAPREVGSMMTDWHTEITVTRREWWPPEATATAEEAGDVENNTAGGSTAEGSFEEPTTTASRPAPANEEEAIREAEEAEDAIEAELSGMEEEFESNRANASSMYNTEACVSAAEALNEASDALTDAQNMMDGLTDPAKYAEERARREERARLIAEGLNPDDYM